MIEASDLDMTNILIPWTPETDLAKFDFLSKRLLIFHGAEGAGLQTVGPWPWGVGLGVIVHFVPFVEPIIVAFHHDVDIPARDAVTSLPPSALTLGS